MIIAFFEITEMEKGKFKLAFSNETLTFFENTIQEVDIEKFKNADAISVFIHSKVNEEILKKLREFKINYHSFNRNRPYKFRILQTK